MIEAIQLLSNCESFRSSKWQEMIKREATQAFLHGHYEGDDRKFDISLNIEANSYSYCFNGKKKQRRDLVQLSPAVLFTPDDLVLVKGPAEQRRSMIDSLGKRISKQYSMIVQDYQKILKQRNRILKDLQKSSASNKKSMTGEDAWSVSLASLGAQLLIQRYRLFQRLLTEAAVQYRKLSEREELSYDYFASFQDAPLTDMDVSNRELLQQQLLENMQRRRSEEIARGLSLVGPHRDEIVFLLAGQDARNFASQGQQRSIALAIKLAEVELIRLNTGNMPLLLLDDVLSELDESRRNNLADLCQQACQSVITATELQLIPKRLYQQGKVIQLTGNMLQSEQLEIRSNSEVRQRSATQPGA